MSDNEKVEKVTAETVIDVNRDMLLVQTMYQQARQVGDLEGLQKLINGLLGDVRYTQATTPHIFTAIALAALKLANGSKHGPLDRDQWNTVAELLGQAMSTDEEEVQIIFQGMPGI